MLQFPSNPSVGDTFQDWKWDGGAWASGQGVFGEARSGGNTGVIVTSGTWGNAASILLPAGDWDVEATVLFPTGPSYYYVNVGLSTTSAVSGPMGSNNTQNWGQSAVNVAHPILISTPVVRFSLSAPTTIWVPILVAATSNPTVDCSITARRRASILPLQPYMRNGLFTGRLTGLTTQPPVNCAYYVIDSLVNLFINTDAAVINGTSNAQNFGVAGVPDFLRPNTTSISTALHLIMDNGVNNAGGAYVLPRAVALQRGIDVQFYKAGTWSDTWTASGTKGISQPMAFTYRNDL